MGLNQVRPEQVEEAPIAPREGLAPIQTYADHHGWGTRHGEDRRQDIFNMPPSVKLIVETETMEC